MRAKRWLWINALGAAFLCTTAEWLHRNTETRVTLILVSVPADDEVIVGTDGKDAVIRIGPAAKAVSSRGSAVATLVWGNVAPGAIVPGLLEAASRSTAIRPEELAEELCQALTPFTRNNTNVGFWSVGIVGWTAADSARPSLLPMVARRDSGLGVAWRLEQLKSEPLESSARWIGCYNNLDSARCGDEQAVITAVRRKAAEIADCIPRCGEPYGALTIRRPIVAKVAAAGSTQPAP
jgi:hypothetical protein